MTPAEIAAQAITGTGLFEGRERMRVVRTRRVIPWWSGTCCCGATTEFRQAWQDDSTAEGHVTRGECKRCDGLFWFELRFKHVDDDGCRAYHYVKLDAPPGSAKEPPADTRGSYR